MANPGPGPGGMKWGTPNAAARRQSQAAGQRGHAHQVRVGGAVRTGPGWQGGGVGASLGVPRGGEWWESQARLWEARVPSDLCATHRHLEPARSTSGQPLPNPHASALVVGCRGPQGHCLPPTKPRKEASLCLPRNGGWLWGGGTFSDSSGKLPSSKMPHNPG